VIQDGAFILSFSRSGEHAAGLQPDFAWAGEGGEEQAFAAEGRNVVIDRVLGKWGRLPACPEVRINDRKTWQNVYCGAVLTT
jgi:hypothetical protein